MEKWLKIFILLTLVVCVLAFLPPKIAQASRLSAVPLRPLAGQNKVFHFGWSTSDQPDTNRFPINRSGNVAVNTSIACNLKTGSITVQLVDTNGNPIAGRTISCSDSGGGAGFTTYQTGGSYQVTFRYNGSGSAAASYIVFAAPSNATESS